MNPANESLLKKNISLTELQIDNRASLYAEQYRLNGPYMLIYMNYDLDRDEHVDRPGLFQEQHFSHEVRLCKKPVHAPA